MKLQTLSRMAVIRASALCCLLLPFLRSWLGGAFLPAASSVVLALVVTDAFMMLTPVAGEDLGLPMRAAVLLLLFHLLSVLICLPEVAAVMAVLASVSIVICVRSCRRHGDLGQVFHRMAAWYSVEESARMAYLSVLNLSGALSVICLTGGRALWLPLVMLSVLLVLLLARWRTGRTFFVSAARERAIKSHIADIPEVENAPLLTGAGEEKEDSLYARIVEVMERDRPYLRKDYNLEALSRDVYTNSNYVSHAVNEESHHGVPRFINSYRIRYAVSLMEENPRLKISELWQVSGFGNPVSFNSAFKIEMKMTPKQYLDSVRSRSL